MLASGQSPFSSSIIDFNSSFNRMRACSAWLTQPPALTGPWRIFCFVSLFSLFASSSVFSYGLIEYVYLLNKPCDVSTCGKAHVLKSSVDNHLHMYIAAEQPISMQTHNQKGNKKEQDHLFCLLTFPFPWISHPFVSLVCPAPDHSYTHKR